MTTNRQFSLALEALASLKPGGSSSESGQSQPVPAAPPLNRVLSEIGPLPPEALFLGIASDGLPVLLNLHNPSPGPMLIVGDSGAGKTIFLQSIVHSLIITHTESDLQFGVITSHTGEWDALEKTGHSVGVFDVNQNDAQDLILSLSSWAHSNKKTTQSVLILIDDLEAIAKMDMGPLQNFRWLLLRGPARHVWPIITLPAERYGQVLAWIELFRARIFGRVANPRATQALCGDPASDLEKLEAGVQFCMRENDGWLRFWLPSF